MSKRYKIILKLESGNDRVITKLESEKEKICFDSKEKAVTWASYLKKKFADVTGYVVEEI